MTTPSPPIFPTIMAPPSSRARELGDDLTRVIQEFQRRHPDLSSAEVHQALRVAESETGSGVSHGGLALGFVLAIMCIGLALAYYLQM